MGYIDELRDRAAVQIAAALVQVYENTNTSDPIHLPIMIAKQAYDYADELVQERRRRIKKRSQ